MSLARLAPTPGTVADRLRRRLLALDYPAFARCVCRLLEAEGYEDVRLAGRREWKGYNRPGGGGYDLEALLPGGLAPRRAVAQIKVIAQIKQFDGLNVHQRSVDELRGACLRSGAAEALLVTTSGFSEVVRRSAAALDPAGMPVAPVRLIDGQELLGLLIRHRLGVFEVAVVETTRVEAAEAYERGLGSVRRLRIDEAFFDSLNECLTHSAKATARRDGAAPGKATPIPCKPIPCERYAHPRSVAASKGAVIPRWRVTVHISSLPGPVVPGDDTAGGSLAGTGPAEGGR